MANRITGNAGNNSLLGEGGADTLIGGAGSDVLSGGFNVERDAFVFNAVTDSAIGSARDIIKNFVTGIDDIVLSAIDANSVLDGNQRFQWSTSTATANSVWYKVSGINCVVRGDVNGDAVTDFEILVANIGAVAQSDFIL